jgi:CDP-glucose 4,6-dehydratase
MGLNRDFWAGKRVFLTGHTGFKGSWLGLWLTHWGAQVTGYSLDPPTEPNLFTIGRLRERLVQHYRADIGDLPTLQAAVAHAEPEIILHLAAQSLLTLSYREPLRTYATNVMGTVHVLEAARHVPSVKAMVLITSDKCYEDTPDFPHPYRESDRLGGHDPYSASKACAELAIASYRASFTSGAEGGTAIASGRAGNVIGGGDWAKDRLVPDCIRAFSKGEPVVLRYPEAVRPWQHVLEPVSGYLTLAECLFNGGGARYASAWNFGPSPTAESTVGQVATRAAQTWGNGVEVQIDRAGAVHQETHLLRLDSSKAHTEIGWRPRWSLDRSIDETVHWYRAWRSNNDMQHFSARQIEDYLQSAP